MRSFEKAATDYPGENNERLGPLHSKFFCMSAYICNIMFFQLRERGYLE
jgi:hypothetical protein